VAEKNRPHSGISRNVDELLQIHSISVIVKYAQKKAQTRYLAETRWTYTALHQYIVENDNVLIKYGGSVLTRAANQSQTLPTEYEQFSRHDIVRGILNTDALSR
jgi:hypothetical protein